MEEKVFKLHVCFLYMHAVTGLWVYDSVFVFNGSKMELNELGKPKVTPEFLESIRKQLKKEHNVDTVTILNWQWFD